MAKQKIVWTVLPHGRVEADGPLAGRWRVSIVVSPRFTPEAPEEQVLGAFNTEWADWPSSVRAMKFALEIGGTTVDLKPIDDPATRPDSTVWKRLFYPKLPVAGFRFKDMSRVNLRSYPVRNVMGFVRRHYQSLSLQAAAGEHPTLLPWRAADPTLKGMLGELGTRTQKINLGDRAIEVPLPGFDRFHRGPERGDGPRPHELLVDRSVFNGDSCIKAPVRQPGPNGESKVFALRALPPDWEDPALIRNGTIQVDPADRERRAQLMAQWSSPAEYAMWQSDRFYKRTIPSKAQLAMRVPSYNGGTTPLKEPEVDVHQRIASYGDHPNLLRRLGLVIDCVLERNEPIDALLAAGIPAQGLMRLKVSGPAPHVASGDTCPQVAWRATKTRFVLQARTDDHVDGLLRLERANDRYQTLHPKEGSNFDLFQVDPDGAALKTVDFLLSAQNLVRRSLSLGADGEVTYTTGDRQPVSTLRSGGLGVSRHGRAGQVAMSAAAAALNHQRLSGSAAAGAQVALYAEDLLRGYRVDVQDAENGRWRSLVQREGRYVALPRKPTEPELPIDLPADEGHVKGASTSGGDEAKPDDHYLHETLFRWSGWSLAAPRPGRTIRDRIEPGTGLQSEEVVEVDDTAKKGNGLAVRMRAAKGTLPRLRYGHTYRVRARLTDLAGNSLALDAADLRDDEQASDPIVYGRFEPVDPPALVLARKVSEGESLERLVLRSNFDRGTAAYSDDIAGDLAAFYASPDFEYGPTAERHVVPPKTSQQTAELHGMFDDAIGSGDPARIKAAYAVAARESGSLMHPVPGAQIELVTPAKAAQAATVQGEGAVIPPPELADTTRDRMAAGQYLIHREDLVPVPYLADPACGGIALHGVPGIEALVAGRPLQLLAPGLIGVGLEPGLRAALVLATKTWVLLVDLDRDPGDDPGPGRTKDWPDDVRSLRLVLAEQPGEVESPPCGDIHTAPQAPEWKRDDGVLRLFLPKGHIARLRYASFVHDRLVQHFGLPRWHADAPTTQRLQAEAMSGANWMLTPWRALTLVHATQQPVCEPWLEVVTVQRGAGDPHADLRARRVHLHGPSTGQFEIVGEWHEWIDDPLADDPVAPGPRRVKHEAQLAEIRLGENHPNVFSLQDAVAAQTAFVPVGGQVQPGDVAKRPAVPGNRHEFGDTRFRFVRYRVRATTRFREYLPPSLFAERERITRVGPAVEEHRVDVRVLPGQGVDTDAGAPVLRVAGGGEAGLVVPASAPPEVPELVYVVPTVRWERPPPSGGTVTSTRWGNGLRVYLERPWFSSGDGELLGVVIPGDNAAFSAVDAALLPFVTQWGRDPLWDGAAPGTSSRVADFPARVADEAVALLEQPARSVHVVGHRVHWDAARKLWYADIELNPGVAYMPFVRLALVRYQPNAIGGARVSRVVLAEFAQVLPRRRAVLSRQAQTLSLSVHGPVPSRGPMRRFNDGGAEESEYADISFIPLPGAQGELGRNRMELVLQTRDATLDSDLAWEDGPVLSSGPAAATTGLVMADPAPEPGPLGERLQRAEATTTVRSRLGRTLRFDRFEQRLELELLRPNVGDLLGPIDVIPRPPVFDPPVFTLTATRPTVPHGRLGRLMLREFERYYTDRTVPEVRAGAVRRRVVVEERLVYAEVFPLD